MQLLLKTAASFRSAVYALVIEDNTNQETQSKRKTYAPVAFGSKVFSAAKITLSKYSKSVLALYMAFLEVAYNLWQKNKTNNCLNKSKIHVTFFPDKAIPPIFWSACNNVLQFNFTIAHMAAQSKQQLTFSPD